MGENGKLQQGFRLFNKFQPIQLSFELTPTRSFRINQYDGFFSVATRNNLVTGTKKNRSNLFFSVANLTTSWVFTLLMSVRARKPIHSGKSTRKIDPV